MIRFKWLSMENTFEYLDAIEHVYKDKFKQILSQMIALDLYQCPKLLQPTCLAQPDGLDQVDYMQREILGTT